MIQEAYCSFEVSKLLKEKGFDEACRSYFINDLGDYRKCAVKITNKNCSSEQILRPTHQMAVAWLRDKYRVFIDAFFGTIIKHKDCFYYKITDMSNNDLLHACDIVYDSYEEAVEDALKYALTNLI